MNNRLFPFIMATLLAFVTLPIALMRPAQAESTRDWTVPEGYNEHDYNAIVSFLEQSNEEMGVKNGEYLNPDYDPNLPETWFNEEMESGIYWEELDGELMLSAVYLRYGFAGELDLSECIGFVTADFEYNSITTADVSDCPNLEYANFAFNDQLAELDLSNCPKVQRIFCNNSSVSELDLSDKTELVGLYCAGSAITELDFSNCYSIDDFDCSECSIRSLDFTNCNVLEGFRCWGCGLEEIVLPNDSSHILTIWCMMNELTELDVSGCTSMMDLYCYQNQITELDLSSCTDLAHLACSMNELTALDVSCCPNLEQLFCAGNHLTELDLSNSPNLPLDTMSASGSGTIGYNFENVFQIYAHAIAVPNEGETFLGWYDEAGVLMSTEEDYDFSALVDTLTVLVARFSGGEVLGDIDGDGETTVSDALLALRVAMELIELTPEQAEAADVNGDGAVTLSDALVILRTAMGLI